MHPNTAARRGGLNNEKTGALITSQSVSGEVLTGAQTYANPILTAITVGVGALSGGVGGAALGLLLGDNIPQVPTAVGDMHKLDSIQGGNPIARHGMNQVIEGIEAQKATDIKTLQGTQTP